MSNMRQETRISLNNERIVQFNCDGQRVPGILHVPRVSARRAVGHGIIFLSSGVRSRRGPNQIYTRFARYLAAAGYHVLRFDPPGIGDSPGKLASAVQYKRQFIDCDTSTIDAINFFTTETGVERITLIGLCTGAYNAIKAGCLDPRVDTLVLASLPVQQFGDMADEDVKNTMMSDYFHYAFSWRSWRKFLTGQSQYDLFLGSIAHLLRGRYKKPKLDEHLWDSFKSFAGRGGQTLFVYGSIDQLYSPFRNGFHSRLKKLDGACSGHKVIVIEGANHTYSQVRFQKELFEGTKAWFDTRSRP